MSLPAADSETHSSCYTAEDAQSALCCISMGQRTQGYYALVDKKWGDNLLKLEFEPHLSMGNMLNLYCGIMFSIALA